MSKNPKPTEAELKFIYSLILQGNDDADILEEYGNLYRAGTLMYPYRTDKRFVRECRKELEVAAEVLKEHVKKQVDPIIIQRRKDHFDYLANVAQGLLYGNLDNVTVKITKAGDQSDIFEYAIWECGALQVITRKQLSDMIERIVELYYEQPKDTYDLDYFLPHLMAEYPEVESKGFKNFVKENPYKLVEILILLSHRKTFKGKCPVCKDW